MPGQQLSKIRDLEHLQPLVLRRLESEVGPGGQAGIADARVRSGRARRWLDHVFREILDRDQRPIGERAGALDHVLELPNVSGPAVLVERLRRGAIQSGHASLAEPLQERLGQQPHIAGPFWQRRQADRDYVDAIVELFPELSARDGLLQISIRGRYHPDVHVHQRGATDSANLTLLKHPQELDLERCRELRDLVEEQGPAMRGLHETSLGPYRSGERALLVSEELGLEEVLGQRGTVHRDERLACAPAVGVDGPGDELLAGAGLAEDEDVGLGAGRLLHQLEDLSHRRTAPDNVVEAEHLLQLLTEVAVLHLQSSVAKAALHREAQLVDREVLG